MADKTGIEWTDATWNPLVGCSRVSPGCDGCYAIGAVHRGAAMGAKQHVGLTTKTEAGLEWNGNINVARSVFDKPLRWAKPRRIFVNSLSDLFHEDVPDHVIYEIWRVMAQSPQHTFQVLTKRPQRMEKWFKKLADAGDPYLPPSMFATETERSEVAKSGRAVMFEAMVDSWGDLPDGAARPTYDWQGGDRWWPTVLPNLHIGVSIESNTYVWRADYLRRTPAAVRFVSAEPLLGPLSKLDLEDIDWVIVGGESGEKARPMHPGWIKEIRLKCAGYTPCDECEETGQNCTAHGGRPGIPWTHPAPTAFFFKQWGEWSPEEPATMERTPRSVEVTYDIHGDDPVTMWRHGKRNTGRTLNGRIYDDYPKDPV